MSHKRTLNYNAIFGLTLTSLTLAGLTASPSYSQSAEDVSDTLDEDVIIVTAQRRAQALSDVPIAITAYDPQTLDTLAVKKTIDLVDTIPNLVGSNNTSLGGANSYFLRGQGQDESFPTFDPAVGTYVDEIFYTRQNGNNINLFDVERLEVLRGPQGTLFGKNTTGGAINVVLRKPGEKLGGFAEVSYGRFNEIVTRGSIDLPASENARFMASGFFVDNDGWLRNPVLDRDLNDRHSWGVRLAADIDISPDINWYAVIDTIDDQGTNITGRDVNLDTGANPADGDYGDVDLVSTSLLPNGLGAVFPGAVSKADYGSQTNSFNVSSNLGIDVGEGTINFIAGYRDVENDFLVNFPLPQFDAFFGRSPDDIFIIDNLGDYEQHSLELKYNADLLQDRLNLTAGLYYLKEDNNSDVASHFASANPSRDRIIDNTTRNQAAYVQGDLKLGDTLTVTGGLRYTDEKKVFEISDNRPVGNITDLTTANMVALGIPTEQREKVWTPRAAVTFEPNTNSMFYLSATRGFRSGGWNARVNNANALIPFSSEFVWSYEAGTRLNIGPAIDLYLTGFHLDVSNLQVNTSLGGGQFGIGNAGSMKNTGLEAEVFLRPTDALRVYGALGLQDARYEPDVLELAACQALPSNSSFGAFDANCNIATVKHAPSAQLTLGSSYRLDFDGVSITPRGSMRVVSDQVTTSLNRGPADSFALFNAGIDFGFMDDALTISAECANCGDKRYLVTTFGNQDTYFNRPGTWTIRLRYNFGGRKN